MRWMGLTAAATWARRLGGRAGNGEFGVALRCAQLDGATARLFAGGGIVADSDPATEAAEAAAKFHAMQSTLDG